jgi:hypothetical protein
MVKMAGVLGVVKMAGVLGVVKMARDVEGGEDGRAC